MDGSGKKRTCPVCDEAVPADAKLCPSCNTDLTLFSVEEAADADVDTEDLKLMASDSGHLSDLLQAAQEPLSPMPSQPAPVEMAECPECMRQIPADATKCPHCGVEFEVEEVFECPLCKSLLDVSVTKCPTCGAEFEGEEPANEEASAPQQPQEKVPEVAKQPEAKPAPEPVPKEPTSFADRLKLMKDEGGTQPAKAESSAPKRELTFAERMKAMKEGTLPETTTPRQEEIPVAQPVPSPKPPAPTPSIQPAQSPAQQRQPEPSPSIAKAPSEQAQPQQPKPAQPMPESSPLKELPRYIGEVKKLLLLANELKLDVSTSKAVINKAVAAGKSHDLDNAIVLVKEGKAGIEKELRTVYNAKVRTLESALALEQKSGADVSKLNAELTAAKQSLAANDFSSASESLKALESHMLATSSSNLSAAELDTVSCAIANAEFLQLNVSEAKAFMEEARISIARNDAEKSMQYAKQASEGLNRILPAFIAGEMRKAKVALMEIKMMNVDISEAVKMLKEANDNVSKGDYCTALQHIREFKEFVDRAQQS